MARIPRCALRSPAIGCLLLCLFATAHGEEYDPLAVLSPDEPSFQDFVVEDREREREIPIRVWLPPDAAPSPVILFSHGLGGSREGYSYLGKHWAARGYAAVFLQHPGSDASVWRGEPALQRMQAMREAASGRNFMLRVRDAPAALDQLETWNASQDHPLAGRLAFEKTGMAGHSFGAVTTQAVGGQRTAGGNALFADERIAAALILSPSSPRRGKPQDAFGNISLPWMLMTGTKDISPIGEADMESRLAVFPALPAGDKYELILHEARHSAFSDHALPGEREARNPNHHRAILALSAAFWDAYLRDNAEAEAWLKGDGPKSILEGEDSWRIK